MTDKEKCQAIAMEKDCRDFRCMYCPLVKGEWNCSKAESVHQAAIQWLKDHPDECEKKGEEKTMEKTEMMKRYEAETGKPGSESAEHLSEDIETVDYVRWLEVKAEAYDRIMSGGKKTMKELANILGVPIAINRNKRILWFEDLPVWDDLWQWTPTGNNFAWLPNMEVDCTVSPEDSLTIPDGWEV